jgi:hypothetical protein
MNSQHHSAHFIQFIYATGDFESATLVYAAYVTPQYLSCVE